jgi:hypothetical protein
MNRREFMGSAVAAALASFILPSPRKRIDLRNFCASEEHPRWSMKMPYEVEEFTYATDGKICVRVRPQLGDKVVSQGPIPPFGSLQWGHDKLTGWRSLRRLSPVEAIDSCCPTCDGYGHTSDGIMRECEQCVGTGHVWVGSDYDISHPKKCPRCKGAGHFPPVGAIICPTCDGYAIGTFPTIVEIDGQYFDAKLYSKAWSLDGEYLLDNFNSCPSYPMLRLRFDGGVGLLMGLDKAESIHRIEGVAS